VQLITLLTELWCWKNEAM